MSGTTVVIEWWMGGAATVVGTVGLSVGGWLVNRIVNKLEAEHKARSDSISEKLGEIGDRQTAVSASHHRFELVLTEMRGAIAAMAARQDAHELSVTKNESAHGRIHGRLDQYSDRLVRVETLTERGAA